MNIVYIILNVYMVIIILSSEGYASFYIHEIRIEVWYEMLDRLLFAGK